MKWKMVLVWALAVLFLIDSILRGLRSNFTFGVLMVYGITAALWGYAIFHEPIDAFCAEGVGYVLKILFLCGCAALALLVAFVALSGYSNRAAGDEEIVVVLGAGLRGSHVTNLLSRRLDAAYAYYVQNPEAIVVVTGGQGRGEDISEAQAMKAYLVEKGMPAEQILTEEKSTSTEENFRFAREVLEEAGYDPAAPTAYVTNAFHCYRAGRYAARAGFSDAHAVPASISPSSVLSCYLREAMAVLYYWVFRA